MLKLALPCVVGQTTWPPEVLPTSFSPWFCDSLPSVSVSVSVDAWTWEHHPAGPQQDPAGGSLWVRCHIVEIVFISLFLTPSIRKTPHEDNIKVTRTSILKLSRREWSLQPQYAPNMSLHCNTDFSFVIALCLFSCGFGHVSSMDPLWRWTSTEQSWWMATAEL